MPDDHIKQVQIMWHPDWEEYWLQTITPIKVNGRSSTKKIRVTKR